MPHVADVPHTWVCFDCRTSARRGEHEDVRCPRCAKAMIRLGYRVPVPSPQKPKEWDALHDRFFRERRETWLAHERDRVRRIHALEAEIAQVTRGSDDAHRAAELEPLERRLAALKRHAS